MTHADTLRARPAPTRPTINGTAPTDLAPSGKSYAQVVLDQVNAGADVVNAAAAAGIDMAQLGDWNREGQIHWARFLAGAVWETDFTPDQQDAVWFHTRLAIALARHRVGLAVITEQIARGGLQRTKTRRKLGKDGQPVEETTTVETLLPDGEMARWKLERLQPDVYGGRGRIDIMLHDLSNSDVQMDVARERLASIRKQFAAREAIDATASEDPPEGP